MRNPQPSQPLWNPTRPGGRRNLVAAPQQVNVFYSGPRIAGPGSVADLVDVPVPAGLADQGGFDAVAEANAPAALARPQPAGECAQDLEGTRARRSSQRERTAPGVRDDAHAVPGGREPRGCAPGGLAGQRVAAGGDRPGSSPRSRQRAPGRARGRSPRAGHAPGSCTRPARTAMKVASSDAPQGADLVDDDSPLGRGDLHVVGR